MFCGLVDAARLKALLSMNRDAAIARNTVWNFVGTTLPLVVAVFTIPAIIRGLGTERFGVLTLAWTIVGYFALFDFGLGRATTKFVANYIERGVLELLPQVVWTSLIAHTVLGLVGGAMLALFAPWLSEVFFTIPPALMWEVRVTFYLLAVSVPLVVVTACLRGLLEAVHRFDLVNFIRIPAGIINYVGPLGVMLFTSNLAAVVGFIVACRAVVLAVHAFISLRRLPVPAGHVKFARDALCPLLRFGGWLTVSNLVSPLIVFIDRFAIGALVSMSAVAYYATPYEIITKLWVFSASLLAALFPVLSALAVAPNAEIRILHRRATRYLLVMVAPIVGLLLVFADELLGLWVGSEFARHSASAAKWLAVGVFTNVLAQVPFTVLQSMGKPDIVARLQLVQLPFYAVAIWYLTLTWGVNGTAIAWAARAAIEFLLLVFAADRLMPAHGARDSGMPLRHIMVVGGALLAFWFIGTAFDSELAMQIAAFGIMVSLLIAWEWRFMLDAADRRSLISAARQTRQSFFTRQANE
jgi:O-antigen/teichoic acid export membrane protein